MKSRMLIAGCGVATMLMLITACAGEEGTGLVKKETTAPTAKAPDGAAPAKDIAAPKPGPGPATKDTPFSAEMSAEFMRKVMETSARIEEVKKQMAERQAVIFETNPEVKAYRAQLIEMQGEINKLLAADAELNTLKMNRDILRTTMPNLPRGNPQSGPARGFGPMK